MRKKLPNSPSRLWRILSENLKFISRLKKCHIINKGKNTQGWWPWWKFLIIPSLLHKKIMLCHLLEFPRKDVNIQKRPQLALMKPQNFWALSKNKWFVLILDGSLENSPKCNLVDNTPHGSLGHYLITR